MITNTSHAPWVNFVIVTMTSTVAVMRRAEAG